MRAPRPVVDGLHASTSTCAPHPLLLAPLARASSAQIREGFDVDGHQERNMMDAGGWALREVFGSGGDGRRRGPLEAWTEIYGGLDQYSFMRSE